MECPTCGPSTIEQHPRIPVERCSNCKEHLLQDTINKMLWKMEAILRGKL